MRRSHGRILCSLLGSLTLGVLATGACEAAPSCPTGAEHSPIHPPTSAIWEAGPAAGEQRRVPVELDLPGLWLVEVRAPALAAVEPRLDAPTAGCHENGDGEESPELLVRQASAFAAAVSAPGDYRFRFAARDPRAELGEVRVMSLLLPWGLKGDPDEDEPDPYPAPVPTPEPMPGADLAGALAPLPSRLGVAEILARAAPACRRLEREEPGAGWASFWGCARALRPGGSVTVDPEGAAEGWVFHLRLASWQTLMFEVLGDSPVVGALLDGSGHRLRSGEGGGAGEAFRLVETLAPGDYFLRVEVESRGRAPIIVRTVPVRSP